MSGLRVAFVAGTLGQGGAEKQLVYIVRALMQAGVDVRVYSLTRGEHYEPALRSLGADMRWIGKRSSPASRLLSLVRDLRDFKPHVVQSKPLLHKPLCGPVSLLVERGWDRRRSKRLDSRPGLQPFLGDVASEQSARPGCQFTGGTAQHAQ